MMIHLLRILVLAHTYPLHQSSPWHLPSECPPPQWLCWQQMIVEENQGAHHLPLSVLLLQIDKGPNRLLAAHSLDFLLFFPSHRFRAALVAWLFACVYFFPIESVLICTEAYSTLKFYKFSKEGVCCCLRNRILWAKETHMWLAPWPPSGSSSPPPCAAEPFWTLQRKRLQLREKLWSRLVSFPIHWYLLFIFWSLYFTSNREI